MDAPFSRGESPPRPMFQAAFVRKNGHCALLIILERECTNKCLTSDAQGYGNTLITEKYFFPERNTCNIRTDVTAFFSFLIMFCKMPPDPERRNKCASFFSVPTLLRGRFRWRERLTCTQTFFFFIVSYKDGWQT